MCVCVCVCVCVLFFWLLIGIRVAQDEWWIANLSRCAFRLVARNVQAHNSLSPCPLAGEMAGSTRDLYHC